MEVVFRRKLYDHTKVCNIPDSRMLFNMSQHVMSNTFEQNGSFLDILQDVQDHATGFKTEITIPFDSHSADEILKEKEHGIFGNLPYEEVHVINGHACVSIIGII